MLWMYQRVMWGEIRNERNANLLDLVGREHAMLIPLLIMMFWMGIYSSYFLRPMDASVMKLMNQTQTGRVEYASGSVKRTPPLSTRSASATARSLNKSGGWGGAGQKNILLTNTTPSAPVKGGSATFFWWRSHPSSAEERSPR